MLNTVVTTTTTMSSHADSLFPINKRVHSVAYSSLHFFLQTVAQRIPFHYYMSTKSCRQSSNTHRTAVAIYVLAIAIGKPVNYTKI